jgi:hypothetical protein
MWYLDLPKALQVVSFTSGPRTFTYNVDLTGFLSFDGCLVTS